MKQPQKSEQPPKTEEPQKTNALKTEELIKEEAKKAALEKVGEKILIVDVNDIAEAEARKGADDNMAESAKTKNIFKKIWKHTFLDAYYRQREVNKIREEITHSGNIYTRRTGVIDKNGHEKAMGSITERFISEYKDVLNEGETKKILGTKDPKESQAISDIESLIKGYASGTMDEEAFKSGRIRIFNYLEKENIGENHGKKAMGIYTDNLFEIAKNAKTAIEHGAKMEEIKFNTDFIIAKAKSSLRTEAHFNFVDKQVDKMKKTKIGRFISPATLSTATGLAYSVLVLSGKKFMSSKVVAIASLGGTVALSSIFSGIGESYKTTEEKKRYGLLKAEGGEFSKEDKRAVELEKFQYQMESSVNLEKNLRDTMFEKDENGKDRVRQDIKEEDLAKVVSALAEIDARKSINSKKKIDLISYTNIENVERESTDLSILTAKAKVEIKKKFSGDLKTGNFKGKTFDSYLKEQSEIIEKALLGGELGIDKKDKEFKKYKTKRIASKMASTATLGFILGGTMQEVVSWFKDDVQGLTEGIFGNNTNGIKAETPLEHIREWLSGGHSHIVEGTAQTHVGAEEYINGHSDSIHHIARDGWYDNNTSEHDLNELNLKWGGESGFNSNGDYSLNVKDMVPGGSFHDGLSIDAQKAVSQGNLKMVFSLTDGTQNSVFEVPIDIHGNITVDPDSEIGKLFFSNENGHAVFTGRFAEVVQTTGVRDGVEHVRTLATLVGHGNNVIEDTVKTLVDTPMENPYFIPIITRKELGNATFKEKIEEKQPQKDKPSGEKYEKENVPKKEMSDKVVEGKKNIKGKENNPVVVKKVEQQANNEKKLVKKVGMTETKAVEKFTADDLFKLDTVFEDKENEYRVIKLIDPLFGRKKVLLEVVNKKTKKKLPTIYTVKKRDLEYQLAKKEISITKVKEEKK